MDPNVWFWIILGAVCLVAEVVVPGMVLVFLGTAAWLVAGLVSLGLVSEPLTAGTAWFVLSLGLIVGLRGSLQRLFPSETSRAEVDEDAEVEDQVVDVVEDVAHDHSRGRIRFGGTTWSARALDEPIPRGGQARLMYRDGLVWVVALPEIQTKVAVGEAARRPKKEQA